MVPFYNLILLQTVTSTDNSLKSNEVALLESDIENYKEQILKLLRQLSEITMIPEEER